MAGLQGRAARTAASITLPGGDRISRYVPPHFIRASLIAPAAAPLLYWIAFGGRALLRGDGVDGFGLQPAWTILSLGGLMSYGAAVSMGLPAVAALAYSRELSRVRTLAIGLVAGLAVAQVLQGPHGGAGFSVWLPYWLGALAGVASAAVWWKLAHR